MKDKWEYPSEVNNLRFEKKSKQYVLNRVKEVIPDQSYKQGILLKRISITSVSVAALLIVLISSTYVSPTMAKVASVIPYFNQFIQERDYTVTVNDTVWETIQKNNYAATDMRVSTEDKKIALTLVGTEQEVETIKEKVTNTIEIALKEKNVEGFSISINHGPAPKRLEDENDPELLKKEQESKQLHDEITRLLKENNYKLMFPIEVRVNYPDRFIYVSVPTTESKERMQKLRELLKTASAEYTEKYGKFKMRVTQNQLKASDQEKRWGQNVILIPEVLMANEEFKVTSFSFSFYPYPLQLEIKTSVHSTDPDAKKYAKNIEEAITEYIQKHENAKDIRNDEYILTVVSKDKKKIN